MGRGVVLVFVLLLLFGLAFAAGDKTPAVSVGKLSVDYSGNALLSLESTSKSPSLIQKISVDGIDFSFNELISKNSNSLFYLTALNNFCSVNNHNKELDATVQVSYYVDGLSKTVSDKAKINCFGMNRKSTLDNYTSSCKQEIYIVVVNPCLQKK